MTKVDWAALAVIGICALFGYRRGLIGSALSLAGIVVGAIAGARLATLVLHGGARSPYTPIGGLVGAVLGAAILQAGAIVLASFLRGSLRLTPLRTLDSLGGLVLGAAAGIAIVWVLGAVALLLPHDPRLREAAQSSAILSRLNDTVSPRSVLNALARIDPFRSLVLSGPPPPAPDPSVTRHPTIAAAGRRVLRVTGTACGLGIEGTGWVAGRDLVVTAAHVVAGERDTQVETSDGRRVLPAQAVAFDARNDVAVLHVRGLELEPLRIVTPRSGTPAALLGYPGNGPLTATPVRVGRTSTVLSQNAYGHGPVTRTVTVLSGSVRHGDSGGPMVDATGAVQGSVFAARIGSRSGYAVPGDLVQRELAGVRGPVSTGGCAE